MMLGWNRIKKVDDNVKAGSGIGKVYGGMVGVQEDDFDQDEEVTGETVYYYGEQMVM